MYYNDLVIIHCSHLLVNFFPVILAGGGRGIYDDYCWVKQGEKVDVVAEGFINYDDYNCWEWQGKKVDVVAEGFMMIIAGCGRARRSMWWL